MKGYSDMPYEPPSDPSVMIDWHVLQLKSLFPTTIQNGLSLKKIQSVSRKFKSAFGISTDPKYQAAEQRQSIELFEIAAKRRDGFIALTRELKNGWHSAARENELRTLARDAAVEALQGFHDHGSVHIKKFYDRSVPVGERLLAYRRWTRTIDYVQDIYAKLPGVLGDNFTSLTKRAENAQVQIRSDAIAELVATDPAVAQALSISNGSEYSQKVLRSRLRDAQSRITAHVLLHSIKTINPNSANPEAFENQKIGPSSLVSDSVGGTIDISRLKEYSAHNRTYNCVRVVPATIGVMFGAKLKAVAALDDKESDQIICTEWANAYEKVYGGKFTNADSLNQLFDAIQACPSGTTGIIYNDWAGTKAAHVSVVSNVGGVVCMVEGQTGEVVVRNPYTGQFENHSLGENGFVKVEPYNPNTLTNIEFLTVHPEVTLTEHDRAKAVIDELHKPFFEMNDGAVSAEEHTAVKPKQYFVPSPTPETEAQDIGRLPIGPPPGPMPAPRPSPPSPPMIGPPPLAR